MISFDPELSTIVTPVNWNAVRTQDSPWQALELSGTGPLARGVGAHCAVRNANWSAGDYLVTACAAVPEPACS